MPEDKKHTSQRRGRDSTTTDGKPPAEGLENAPAPQPDRGDGQHGAYWVLTEDERAKGFVRPVRDTYQHVGPPPEGSADRQGKGCGTTTTMSRPIAETYAAQPDYYGSTFCVKCGGHFKVGELGEFVWAGTKERVGT